MDQSQQSIDSSCIPLLSLASCSVEYPMPYASCLASCSVGWRLFCSSVGFWISLLLELCYPIVLCLMQLSFSEILGFCSPFYLGFFALHLSLQLGWCTLGWLVWPVIGYPLLGVHSSISIVKLIVTGYCCNPLGG